MSKKEETYRSADALWAGINKHKKEGFEIFWIYSNNNMNYWTVTYIQSM